ncbi:hypothetical protein [Paramagnetospirillum caucaseum]|uniref:hypothetical protein n=1 Tax=Paramagnetospirillum caucaseum TaxID=1244869 RepID=UPI0009D96567|nr:hypothetical protein [Paramagnetospirillum caucaseum]
MSRSIKGTKVPFAALDSAESPDLAAAIADALRTELGSRSVAKTVARWTGVSDRAVKKWLTGKVVPNGEHLVVLMRHSDLVWAVVRKAAGR